MGSGKSSVGRRIASRAGHRFVDTDALVTARAGQSITQIFAQHGEAYFRDLETATLAELDATSGIVLATGGGIVLRAENRAALRRIGVVAWLDADPDALFERVSRNRKRPLLQTGNPRASFDTLLASRREIYASTADFSVDSTHLSHDDAARAVVEAAENCARTRPDGFGS
jgi:shikimate kinase